LVRHPHQDRAHHPHTPAHTPRSCTLPVFGCRAAACVPPRADTTGTDLLLVATTPARSLRLARAARDRCLGLTASQFLTYNPSRGLKPKHTFGSDNYHSTSRPPLHLPQ